LSVCQNSELRNTPPGPHTGNRHPECDVPKRRPETLLQKRRPECDVPECRPKTALQNRRPKCGAGMQEPGREGGNAERNAGGGPGAGAAARIRRPKRGAECGGQVWVGARDRGTPPGTRDRSARPERTARNTGPECEPGCVGRSARPTQGGMRGAGARGPGCEGRNTGPERGDRSLSPERESLLPKSALQIRHPKRGAECGGRSGSEHGTGVRRPEHGTGVRAGVRRQECGDRSAEAGVRRQECGGRSARTGCEDRSERTRVRAGVRGPKREAGCGAGCGLRT
jgi:hypothetical protein